MPKFLHAFLRKTSYFVALSAKQKKNALSEKQKQLEVLFLIEMIALSLKLN